jgi:2-hydroxy-6-oxonona-2,4-dienedioate hydrolase
MWSTLSEAIEMTAGSIPSPAVQHRELQTPEGPIHYVEAGSGAPVLLIHGGHGAWVHWIANIDALARHRRVLALDLPGFGHSYGTEHRPEVADYAAAVSSFIEALGLRNTALVGFSFGTLVAATVASNEPGAVSTLTLINPPGIGERTAAANALPERLSALAKEQGLHAGVAGSLNEVMLNNKHLINPALIDLIADCVTRTRHATRSLSRKSQMIPILEKVSQNTMVLLGAKDPYHCHELDGRSARINRALGTESVKVIGDAAHWVQYDQPDIFNQTLLEFISV